MRQSFLLSFLLLLVVGAYSQQQDFRVWSGVSAEFDLSKNIEIQIEEEIRFRNNATDIEKNFSEAGFNFKIGDVYRIKPAARLTREFQNDYWRFQLDQSLKFNLPDKFWWSHRLRVQYNQEDPWDPDDYRFRYQTTLLKKLGKDFRIYVEPEIFFKYFYDFQDFYQYRLEGGMEIDLGKEETGELKLFYIFEEEFNREMPLQSHIVGVSLGFSFF